MKEILEVLNTEQRECELCGSNNWRILHAGDESNCECEGECLRVCDNPLIEDGCDGIAELIEIISCPTEICTSHKINRTTGQDIHRGERL